MLASAAGERRSPGTDAAGAGLLGAAGAGDGPPDVEGTAPDAAELGGLVPEPVDTWMEHEGCEDTEVSNSGK